MINFTNHLTDINEKRFAKLLESAKLQKMGQYHGVEWEMKILNRLGVCMADYPLFYSTGL